MGIADEIVQLQELHQSGVLSDEEFATAKRTVLAGGAEQRAAPHIQKQLDQLTLQNELMRVDREWELERERYMVRGKYGHRSIPKRGASILGGVFITTFGTIWTFFTVAMAADAWAVFHTGLFSVFPCFGVLFILFGIVVSVRTYQMAANYETAQRRYLSRRAEITSTSPTPSPKLMEFLAQSDGREHDTGDLFPEHRDES